MQLPPNKPNPELDRLIADARSRYEAMTPEQRKAQDDAQRESWVRGELGWPKDCPLERRAGVAIQYEIWHHDGNWLVKWATKDNRQTALDEVISLAAHDPQKTWEVHEVVRQLIHSVSPQSEPR